MNAPPFRLKLLGPPVLELGRTDFTASVSGRGVAMLAYLATLPDRRARRDTLLAFLWPDGPDGQIRSNLRTLLTRLRKHLRSHLRVDRTAVALDPSARWWSDLADFDAWTRQAEGLAPEPAAQQRERALRLVRGPFLEGIGLGESPRFADWLEEQRTTVGASVRAQRIRLAEALRDSGRARQAEEVARDMLRSDPLDEAGVMELMRAQAARGDADSARRTFTAYRSRLHEALRAEPGYGVADLAARIEWDERARVEPAGPAPDAAAVLTTSFVGRNAELERLSELLGDRKRRIVTILGAGGTGKSRLAREVLDRVAGHFADGVLFAALPRERDAAQDDDAAPTVAAAICRAAGLPSDRDAPDEWLAERNLLVVLDGAERWVDARAAIATLAHRAPLATFLVTSRELLGVAAETVFLLDGLPADAAAELFLERSLEWTRTKATDGDAVAALCELLEGLPLGIEIAASNLGDRSLEEIVRDLHDAPGRLQNRRDGTPASHRSLAAAFAPCWDGLGGGQREALADLALFTGPFDDAAALDAAGVPRAMLAGLRAKSLLQTRGGLYSCPTVVRQMVQSLTAAGDGALAPQDRLARHVRGVLGGLAGSVKPRTRGAWYRDVVESAATRAMDAGCVAELGAVADRLARFLGPRAVPILRAAHARTDIASVRRILAVALATELNDELHHGDAAAFLAEELARPEPSDRDESTWMARTRLVEIRSMLGNRDALREEIAGIEEGARTAGAEHAALAARRIGIRLAPSTGDVSAAVAAAERGCRDARALGSWREEVQFRLELARLRMYHDLDAAFAELETARGVALDVDDFRLAATVVSATGTLFRLRGDLTGMAHAYREALRLSDLGPTRGSAPWIRYNLANSLCELDRLEDAEQAAREARKHAQRLGLPGVAARSQALLANVLIRLGELELGLAEARGCLAEEVPGSPVIEPLMDALVVAGLLGNGEAAGYATRIKEILDAGGLTPWRTGWGWTILARHRLQDGDAVAARAAFERAAAAGGTGGAQAELELMLLDLDEEPEDREDDVRRRWSTFAGDRMHWLGYRVAARLRDPAAHGVLESLATGLETRAQRIRSPARRKAFLEDAPDNGAILAEWHRVRSETGN